jgi:hypothetical protein
MSKAVRLQLEFADIFDGFLSWVNEFYTARKKVDTVVAAVEMFEHDKSTGQLERAPCSRRSIVWKQGNQIDLSGLGPEHR